MIPYVGVIFGVCLLLYFAEKFKPVSKSFFWFVLLLSIGLLSFFSGVRDWSVGIDVLGYCKGDFDAAVSYSQTKNPSYFWFISNASGTEPLWLTLDYIFVKFSNNFSLYLGVLSFVTLLPAFMAFNRLVEKSNNVVPLYLFVLLYLLFYYAHSFNLLRQSVATSLTLCAFAYSNEKKWCGWPFWILSIIAIGFHKTAIIAMLSFFFLNFLNHKTTRTREYWLFIILIGGVLCWVLVGKVIVALAGSVEIFSRYEAYVTVGTKGWQKPVFPKTMFLLLSSLFLGAYFLRNKGFLDSKESFSLLYLLILTLLTTMFATYTASLGRFSFHFMGLVFYYLLYLVNSRRFSVRSRYCFNMAMSLFWLFWFFKTMGASEAAFLLYHSEIIGI